MKYRSRMDIAAAIVDLTKDGAIRTRILYNAFLSYSQLRDYLTLLEDGDMIKYSTEEKKYYATEKGRRFLKMYKEVDGLVPKENMFTKVIER